MRIVKISAIFIGMLISISLTGASWAGPNGGGHLRTAGQADFRIADQPVVIGSGWLRFEWDTTNSPFVNPCGDFNGSDEFGNPTCSPGSFNFNSASIASITVTDAFYSGDMFNVSDGTKLLGNTSSVSPSTGDFVEDPDAALLNSNFSSGCFDVGMGPHSINITVIQSAIADNTTYTEGAGFIKVEARSCSNISFDTGAGTYPSVSGVHNGTITLTQSLVVNQLYTYPSPGTGGHSEYAALYDQNGDLLANGTWSGYKGDWHNITFNQPFILEAGVTYTYEIRTGSYPQIIHQENYTDSMGNTITSTEFIAANGRNYMNWIPAIRLGYS